MSTRGGLFWCAAAILVFNLLDGLFTLGAVQAGAATEANPFMELPMNHGAVWFILVKTALVSLGVMGLWRARQRLLAGGALVALSLVYAGIIAYHMSELGAWAHRLG